MNPDLLIHDEAKRHEQDAWEPLPLHLPLQAPTRAPAPRREERDEDEEERSSVLIIDMNDYSILES